MRINRINRSSSIYKLLVTRGNDYQCLRNIHQHLRCTFRKHRRICPVVCDCIRDLQEQFIDILTAYSPKIEKIVIM